MARTEDVQGLLLNVQDSGGDEWLRESKHRDLVCFTMHWALTMLIEALSIDAAVLYGWGVGEFSAACAAGMLEWEEGLRLVLKRSDTLAGLQPGAFIHVTRRQFTDACKAVSVRSPNRPYIAASLGRAVDSEDAVGGRLFAQQLLQTPDPNGGLAVLEAFDTRYFIQMGGAPRGGASDTRFLSLIEPGIALWDSILSVVASLFVAGVSPRMEALDAPFGYQRCDLPTYAFERHRCWLGFPEREYASQARQTSSVPDAHPLLKSVHDVLDRRSGFIRKGGEHDSTAKRGA